MSLSFPKSHESNRTTRSDKYQYLIKEVPIDFTDQHEKHTYQLAFTNEDIAEEQKELKEKLVERAMQLAKGQFTPRQLEVLNCLLDGKTQGEIAKDLNVNQSTVTKTISGTHIYKTINGKPCLSKIYGGFSKKLKDLANHPELKTLMDRLTELSTEGYSFSYLFKDTMPKPPSDAPKFRPCKQCNQEKPCNEEHFYKSAKSDYGLQAICKTCHSANVRAKQVAIPPKSILKIVPTPKPVTPAKPAKSSPAVNLAQLPQVLAAQAQLQKPDLSTQLLQAAPQVQQAPPYNPLAQHHHTQAYEIAMKGSHDFQKPAPVSVATIFFDHKEPDLVELARLLVGKTNQLAALQAEIDQIKNNMRDLLSKA